eukprot:s7657_g1.t1
MQLPAKRLCKAANGKRNSAPWSGGVSADVRALMWQLAADRRQRSWRRVIGTLTLARRQHIELDVFVYGAATSVYAESSQCDGAVGSGRGAKALTEWMPLGPGPSPGRFRHIVFWQLSLWCLNYSGRCSTRRADEIAEGAAWDWPSGAFLRFGNDSELIYTRITTSAGLTISDLQITVPVAECREWNASDLGPYTLLIHMHDASYLELLLHITADENSTLFLGPSLDDGYEITLASEQGISSVRRLLANRVQGSTQEQGLWALPGARLSIRLSWQLLLGAGTLRPENTGRWGGAASTGGRPGGTEKADARLQVFAEAFQSGFAALPAGRITSGPCSSWLGGLAALIFSGLEHRKSLLLCPRDGTRPSECEETLQDVAVPSSEWQSWPLPLVLTDNRLEALENFSFMQGCLASELARRSLRALLRSERPKRLRLQRRCLYMQPDWGVLHTLCAYRFWILQPFRDERQKLEQQHFVRGCGRTWSWQPLQHHRLPAIAALGLLLPSWS